MAKATITILTEPITPLSKRMTSKVMVFCRNAKRFFMGRSLIRKQKYPGHYAVTRSLVEGLRKNRINFSLNPARTEEIKGKVIVLSDVDALKAAIEAKRAGYVSRLLVGPNTNVFAKEYASVLRSLEVDVWVVPCEWVKTAYLEDMPWLKDRVEIWPAGVDEEYWKPTSSFGVKDSKTVLIYRKSEDEGLYEETKKVVELCGWDTVTVNYGDYKLDEFKDLLNQSKYAIFLSRSESQGLALVEAWSMDVPTIVWDPGKLTYLGRKYSVVSACPYLTQTTGRRWTDINELENILRTLKDEVVEFKPRSWVVQNMTDRKAAEHLMSL